MNLALPGWILHIRQVDKTLPPMKKLLIPFIVFCGALLPQAQADGPASKTFGGFPAGKKFIMTVQSVTSSQSVGKKIKSSVPIPTGIPSFKNGQTVKFTIGRNGELTAPGFSIPLLNSSANINSYAKLPNINSLSPNDAGVYKDASGKPVGSTLIFYKYRLDGFTASGLTINQVSYVLK